MIFDRRQLARRLFDSIVNDEDICQIELFLLKNCRNIIHIDLNCLERDGQSLVHLCCLHGRIDLLKLFVEWGKCDVMTINRDGWLPLHIAVYLGHMDIVWYLLECQKMT